MVIAFQKKEMLLPQYCKKKQTVFKSLYMSITHNEHSEQCSAEQDSDCISFFLWIVIVDCYSNKNLTMFLLNMKCSWLKGEYVYSSFGCFISCNQTLPKPSPWDWFYMWENRTLASQTKETDQSICFLWNKHNISMKEGYESEIWCVISLVVPCKIWLSYQ